MRKITNRAFSLLLIAALVICGMGVYLMNYIDKVLEGVNDLAERLLVEEGAECAV